MVLDVVEFSVYQSRVVEAFIGTKRIYNGTVDGVGPCGACGVYRV